MSGLVHCIPVPRITILADRSASYSADFGFSENWFTWIVYLAPSERFTNAQKDVHTETESLEGATFTAYPVAA